MPSITTRVVLATVTAALLCTAAPSSGASERAGGAGDPGLSGGRVLPIEPSPAQDSTLAVGDTYLVADLVPDDYGSGGGYEVGRLADGEPLRAVPATGVSLVGDTLVEEVAVANGSEVRGTDPSTGDLLWTVPVPATESTWARGEGWVVSVDSATGQGFLRRPATDPVPVPGLHVAAFLDVPHSVQDGRIAVLRHGSGVWIIDLATSDIIRLTTTAGPYARMILGPTRIFWVGDDPVDGNASLVQWVGRDGTGPGEAHVAKDAGTREYTALGSGLGVLHIDDGDTAFRMHYYAVDLAAGTRAATAALSGVLWARSTPSGLVVATVDDPFTGAVVTLDGPSSAPVRRFLLTPRPLQPGEVALDGDRVAVEYDDRVEVTPADGSGGYAASLSPGQAQLGSALLGAAGGAVLAADGAWPPTRALLTSDAGQRVVTHPWGLRPQLAPGGRVLLVPRTDGAQDVVDARTGAVLRTTTDGAQTVDGWLQWSRPDPDGLLRASDLRTGLVVRTARPPGAGGCGTTTSVRGRWAILSCPERGEVAVDLDGVLLPRELDGTATDWRLGAGFAVGRMLVPGAGGTPEAVALACDLGPGQACRQFGPVFRGPVTDDADRSRFAFAAYDFTLRVADVDWLTTSPTTWTDSAPPTVTGLSGPDVVTTGPAPLSWTAEDTTSTDGEAPSGVDVFTVRLRRQPLGGEPGGWTQPVEWQQLRGTTLSVGLPDLTRTCLEVRATDRSGNVGAWSAEHCVTADSTYRAVARWYGPNRYATSATISRSTFAADVPVAFIASGTSFPDALSAGSAAGAAGGPVLLTPATSLPTATRDELTRLRPARIVVLGGTSAVSDTVLTQLEGYTSGTVSRWYGPNRYATSATISRSTFAADVPVAFIASGTSFPDALSAGSAAGAAGGPVLLTPATSLPTATRDELTRLRPARIVVLGGTSAVSDTVLTQLEGYTSGTVSRWYGPNRYATSATISRSTFAADVPVAFIASGTSFPDALSAGSAAGAAGGPVLLTPATSLPTATRDELTRLRPARIVVLGGTSAVSDTVLTQLEGYLSGP